MNNNSKISSSSENYDFSNTTDSSLLEEITRYLPDATEEQVGKFTTQVERLRALEDFFQKHPEELNGQKILLLRAQKALDYQRPYRIAIIGEKRVGKSTLINAILGRKLVLMKPVGKVATGTALEIFLDVYEGREEKASVAYRDQDSIRQLIKYFLKRYQINNFQLNNINPNLATELLKLKPAQRLDERASREFIDLRKVLADVVVQSTNNDINRLQTSFSLDNQRDINELMELADENSDRNREGSPRRIIGLIKTITYHIQPELDSAGIPALRLPENVCLVDLPGLDGTPLHDIIISEGIKEADAVIFALKPQAILGSGETYLLDRVNKYIGLEGSKESAERIFFVLNAMDSITVDRNRIPENLSRDMLEMVNLIVKGYSEYFAKRGGDTPYFKTSALAAVFAREKLQGRKIQDINTYERTKNYLGIQDDDDYSVIQASGIPNLVQALTNFAENERIDGQIREGTSAINSIVDQLYTDYEKELQRLTGNRGRSYLNKILSETLQKQKKELIEEVYWFGKEQLKDMEQRKKQLKELATEICNKTDEALKRQLPKYWEKAFTSRFDKLTREPVGKVFDELVLSQTQIDLWNQLNMRIPFLAQKLVMDYRSNWETYGIAQKISQQSYSYIRVQEVKSWLKESVDEMNKSISQVAERIAVTIMADVKFRFTANPEEKQHLYQALASLHNQPKTQPGDFDNFMQEVRKQYQDCVVNSCVAGLLNLFYYEMLRVEDALVDLIEDTFDKLGKTTDPALQAKIRQSLNADPDLQKVELLNRKLAGLADLR